MDKKKYASQDPLQAQVTPEKGVSDVGIEIRRADPRNKGIVSHGYGRISTPETHKKRAIDHLKSMVDHIRKQPKPDLPKSEPVEKADKVDKIGLSTNTGRKNQYNNTKGVNKPVHMAPEVGISGQGYTVRGAKSLGLHDAKFRQPQGGPKYDRGLARQKAKEVLSDLKSMPKPNLPKSEPVEKAVKKINPKDPVLNYNKVAPKAMDEDKKKNYEAKVIQLISKIKEIKKSEKMEKAIQPSVPMHHDIVAGVKVPHELKSHSAPVPYEHPHRELAVNFVTQVHRKNRAEGARMSEKYLGIGEGGKVTHANALHPSKRASFIPPEMNMKTPSKATEGYAHIKKSVKPQPASLSEPLTISRGTTSSPKVIDQPNTVNAYKSENSESTGRMMALKDIINALKSKKGKV